MHLKRWITGIIALPILYLLVWVGGIVFYLLVAAASIITLWEYYRIVFASDGPFQKRLMPILGLVFAPAIVLGILRRENGCRSPDSGRGSHPGGRIEPAAFQG